MNAWHTESNRTFAFRPGWWMVRGRKPVVIAGLLLGLSVAACGCRGRVAEALRGAVQDAAPAMLPGGAWTVDGAAHDGVSLDVSGQTQDTRSVDFKPDGTLLYVIGRETTNVAAYALSKPWDISTASYVNAYEGIGRDVPGRESKGCVAHGIFFRKSDGRKMYVWNRIEGFEYDLAKPWDVTTAVPTGYKSFKGIVKRGHDMDFKPDGTKFYVDDRDSGAIFQFRLVKPWSLASAELEHTFDISDWQKQVRGIQFSPDGRRLFVLDTVLSHLVEYRLKKPWELSAAVEHARFDVQRSDPRGVTWRPDGLVFFITETDGGVIHAYRTAAEPADRTAPTGINKRIEQHATAP